MMAGSRQRPGIRQPSRTVVVETSPYRIRTASYSFIYLLIANPTARPPKQTFDLQSFSYACIGGIPQPECAISVWGWKPDGRKLFRPITFPRLDPGHYPNEFVMNATTFGKDWQDLKSVGFSIARKDNGGDMYAGLWLDDVKYTITTGC
jgi:hypothetical protein